MRGAVHLVETILLAGEVAVDRALSDAGPERDVRRRGAEEPGRRVELERCTEQLLAGGRAVAARGWSGHSRKLIYRWHGAPGNPPCQLMVYRSLSMLDFQQLWNQALSYDDFVAASDLKHRGLWHGLHRLARIPGWALAAVPADAALKLLVLAEDWCGDASNTVPVLAKLTDLTPGLELRILRRDEHPEVMDRYLTNGSRSIPVVIVLDGGFQELGHWGPRPRMLQECAGRRRDHAAGGPRRGGAGNRESGVAKEAFPLTSHFSPVTSH